MPKKNTQWVRREFLHNGFIAALLLLAGPVAMLNKSSATAGPVDDARTTLSALIEALRSTGNAACLAAADRLAATRAAKAEYNLHLRNARLGPLDAEIIAGAMGEAHLNKGPALRSLSMSYNPGLTDSGVVALARAFPPTLTELGFVACALGDEAGEALLRWSKEAAELRMICVEKNHFSAEMRRAFTALAQERAHLLVVV